MTTHAKSFWVVPAPEAFSRHSGTCRLLGDRKHAPAPHVLQVGDFLRVGSVGVVVIETHDGVENRVLSEERIQKIMKDTTSGNGGFLDLGETDGGKFLEVGMMSFTSRSVKSHLFDCLLMPQKIRTTLLMQNRRYQKIRLKLETITLSVTCVLTTKIPRRIP